MWTMRKLIPARFSIEAPMRGWHRYITGDFFERFDLYQFDRLCTDIMWEIRGGGEA
jgi:hypothetical protein